MKINQIILTITTLFIFLFFCFTPAMAGEKKIQWQSYDTGIQMIKDQNKKGFLHFYTNWCGYCKKMNRETFSDSKIVEYMNNNFIPIKVNADKQKDIARKYGVHRFPSNWFIAEDSSSLSNQPGYIPPEMLLTMLKFLNTDSFKTMKFSEFVKKQANAADPQKNSSPKNKPKT